MGPNPIGYIAYHADGRMMAMVFNRDRRLNGPVPTDEEKVALFDSMLACSASYTLEERRIIHHLDGAWSPAWKGALVRPYRIAGRRLFISSAPGEDPVIRRRCRLRSRIRENAVRRVASRDIGSCPIDRTDGMRMKAITHIDQALEEWRAGVRTRRLVAACDGATSLCIFDQWIDPGSGPPTHFHSVEEILTVFDGAAVFWFDGERIELACGSSLIVPARTRHGFRNTGATVFHLRAVLASPSFEASFDGVAEPVWRWAAASEPGHH